MWQGRMDPWPDVAAGMYFLAVSSGGLQEYDFPQLWDACEVFL